MRMIDTPYYLIDIKKLKCNYDFLYHAFSSLWPNFKIGYSFKTNNLPWVLDWMREQGAYAEVVSTPEYRLARKLGYSDKKVILNGPNKGMDTMMHCLLEGGIVNLDSFHEIKFLLEHKAFFVDKPVKVGLRINFNLEKICSGATVTGKEPGRFGFNIENGDLKRAIELLKEFPCFKIVGLHGHHSTKTKSLDVFYAITSKMCEIASYIPNLEYLDIGGCFFGDKPGAPTFNEYAETIVRILRDYKIDENVCLIVEPGAALIASPVSYICQVIDIKTISDVRLVMTDGSSKHIDPQMNGIKFTSSSTARLSCRYPRQVVAGYTCIENDRFLDLCDENELSVGDLITIYNVGAYTMSLTPLFIEYFPAVVVCDGVSRKVVREQWDTDCFMQKNYI